MKCLIAPWSMYFQKKVVVLHFDNVLLTSSGIKCSFQLSGKKPFYFGCKYHMYSVVPKSIPFQRFSYGNLIATFKLQPSNRDIGRTKGASGTHPPRPNSFILIQFSAKNLQINTNLGVGASTSVKSWIRHREGKVSLTQNQKFNCFVFQ